DNDAQILAVELCAAARAQELRRPLEPSPATAAVRALLRKHVGGAGPDRFVAPELAAARTLILSGAVIEAAELVTGWLQCAGPVGPRAGRRSSVWAGRRQQP